MMIDTLKANTIDILEKANAEGLRMLGAGIIKGFFLKIVLMFAEGFDYNPADLLCGRFRDDRHHALYVSFLQVLINDISVLYGLSREEATAVLDETARETLEGFKQQAEQI